MKHKKITSFSALMILVGTIVGSGIFFNAGIVLQNVRGNGFLSLLAWVISGILTIASGLTIAELGALFPRNSGIVVYLEHSYGKKIAFLASWVQTVLYFPASYAAVSLVFGTQLANSLQLNATYGVIFCIITMFCIAMLDFINFKLALKFQSICTILKFVPIIIIIIFGLLYNDKLPITNEFPLTYESNNTISYLGSAVLTTLFAYDGWICIGNLAGEIENPKKNIPKIMFIGLILVTIVYVCINFVYLSVASPTDIVNSSVPGVLVAQKLFSGYGKVFVEIGILISLLGSLNGTFMAGRNEPLTMINHNWLPFSSKLQNKSYKKLVGSLITFSIAVLMLLTGAIKILMALVVFSLWVFIILVFMSVFRLRKKYGHYDIYRVPFYPVTPIIAIIGGLWIVINTILVDMFVFGYFLIFILLGVILLVFKKID